MRFIAHTPRLVIALPLLASAAWLLAAPQTASAQLLPEFSLEVTPALPFAGDRVTITVLAANFSASSTAFTWFRDDVRLGTVSGVGRSAIAIATDPASQETIRVRLLANPGPGFNPREQSVLIYTFPTPGRQSEEASGLGDGFTLQASSVSPDAGETVDIEVITFAFDKNAATYQWYVDGALDRAASGRGQSRFTLPAPPEGAVRTVRVDVTAPGGGVRSKSATIQTASAPLYWWADTAVPYWYRGKALPSLGSRVTALALPSARDPSQLSYQWRFNASVLPRASGVGKQTFSFTFDLPVEEQVGVRMQDTAGTFDKSVGIRIAPVRPAVGIYEVRPLRGVVPERELTGFGAPAGDAYDFLAVPFFFPRAAAAALRYTWSVNGEPITGTFAKPWLLTMKPRAGETSSSEVRIEVAGPQQGGERAATFIRAEFQ